ncbi:alcohol dehydrogenase GroES-like domain-containing protein [Stagonosporopsis vannaccii]|nr:alcohol dehydrogenase GroES-like domain-containing protein [Stagonosporopsis vannaccii]
MALNSTMRAVMFSGIAYNVTLNSIPVPQISNPNDVIVRITTAALCGSDLHTYHGLVGGSLPTWTMGHEAMGYITEIGSAVTTLSVGDYVVIPDSLTTGHYESDGPEQLSFYGSGFPTMGDGLQAEFAHVRDAVHNLIPVPLTKETTNASIERDYMLVGDIFPTAYAALEWSGFQSGDTVAVFGCGPVGQLASYTAILRGASRVYCVDHWPQRLEMAASIGAIPINFVESDPVAQIMAYEPNGVVRSVDCVGLEAKNAQLELDVNIVIQNMVAVTRPGGGIGVIGVYVGQPSSSGAPLGDLISPNVTFPMTNFFVKGLTVRGGLVNPKDYSQRLVDMISSGVAKPGFIKTSVIGIEQLPEYYARFSNATEVKVYIDMDPARQNATLA